MKPEDRELLRENILVQCVGAPRAGIPVSTIIQRAMQAGYEELTGADVDKEIRHLEGKNFIREVEKKLSPENRRYVGTPEGDDYLAIKGLA
jgi:hypothetical protein